MKKCLKLLILFLFFISIIGLMFGCGGTQDEDLDNFFNFEQRASDENQQSTDEPMDANIVPVIVKEKIADTIIEFLNLETNPQQSNIIGNQRLRKRAYSTDPSSMYLTNPPYAEVRVFDNDTVSSNGMEYYFISGKLRVSYYDLFGQQTNILFGVNEILLEWEDVNVVYEKFEKEYNMLINGSVRISGLLMNNEALILESENYSKVGMVDGIQTDFMLKRARLIFSSLSPYPMNESNFDAAIVSGEAEYDFQCLFDGSYVVDVSVDTPIIDSFSLDLTNASITETGDGFDWAPIIASARNKVVLVRSFYGDDDEPSAFGTGCVISPDGVIVTNNHVVNFGVLNKRLSRVSVEFYQDFIAQTGITHNVTGIDYRDKRRDLAYLKIDREGLDYFSTGDSELLKKDDNILHIGHPENLQWWESKGVFLQTTTAADMGFDWLDAETMIFQHSAPANHGSSGGAIINMDEELCGVLFAGYPGSMDTKARVFALHSRYIAEAVSLTFHDLTDYMPSDWIMFDGNEVMLPRGTEYEIPDYRSLNPIYQDTIEEISSGYIYIQILWFYDLDGNNIADHLLAKVYNLSTSRVSFYLAWDDDGDQFSDRWALDVLLDGVAD